MTDYQHGTTYGYARGCRCDECRAAAGAYQRRLREAKKNGEYISRRTAGNQCTAEGCDRKAIYATPAPLCGAHYMQNKRSATLKPIRSAGTCSVDGCDVVARYHDPDLCGGHYQQATRGVPFAALRRKRFIVDGMKECRLCAEVKPVGSFAKRNDRGHVSSECTDCLKIYTKSLRYGITFDEVKSLIARPCEACGSTENLHIDHCHDTGVVRGALCHNCNTVLTKHMTPEILRRLASYLEESPPV